jgi:alpha/beta superfamily hydrolase
MEFVHVKMRLLILVFGFLVAASAKSIAAPPETVSVGKFHLEWTGVIRDSNQGKSIPIQLQTSRGDIRADYYPATTNGAPTKMGVVWVEGAGNHGPDGPPDTIYPPVCERLQRKGIAGLRLHYRRPGFTVHCVLDTLCGIAFLQGEGIDRIALVGHSFGGAVVISAGAISPVVRAVVPMSSQTEDTEFASRVSPRSMLLIHGTSDSTLPPSCSEEIYAEAKEPKELRLFRGAGHDLFAARDDIIDLLVGWIPEQLAR